MSTYLERLREKELNIKEGKALAKANKVNEKREDLFEHVIEADITLVGEFIPKDSGGRSILC